MLPCWILQMKKLYLLLSFFAIISLGSEQMPAKPKLLQHGPNQRSRITVNGQQKQTVPKNNIWIRLGIVGLATGLGFAAKQNAQPHSASLFEKLPLHELIGIFADSSMIEGFVAHYVSGLSANLLAQAYNIYRFEKSLKHRHLADMLESWNKFHILGPMWNHLFKALGEAGFPEGLVSVILLNRSRLTKGAKPGATTICTQVVKVAEFCDKHKDAVQALCLANTARHEAFKTAI
jgi:hypothetical protein